METIVLENSEKTTEELVQKGISKAMTYQDYRLLVDELSARGRSTGPEQTEVLTNYTVLNQRRMKRLDKTLKIYEDSFKKINGFNKKITWLVLTESWCGDAAQTLPMINKVAELNDNISLKVILRDDNLDIMNRFLTNDAMSIPKLIMIGYASGEILGDWGPRPKEATQMVSDYKKEHGQLTAEFKEALQVWYNKDKGQGTLNDLLELLALE
ncbi:MAG: thioredoxin family protein [Maribacter sp.]|nr:thioredoxin family protein [Maribacter sp.]